MMQNQIMSKAPDAGTFEARNNESSYRNDSSSMVRGYRAARRPYRNEPSRPATLRDVIRDRGEYVGHGVALTAGGLPYEPLDWSYLRRCA
jgi:hypothetical protein